MTDRSTPSIFVRPTFARNERRSERRRRRRRRRRPAYHWSQKINYTLSARIPDRGGGFKRPTKVTKRPAKVTLRYPSKRLPPLTTLAKRKCDCHATNMIICNYVAPSNSSLFFIRRRRSRRSQQDPIRLQLQVTQKISHTKQIRYE